MGNIDQVIGNPRWIVVRVYDLMTRKKVYRVFPMDKEDPSWVPASYNQERYTDCLLPGSHTTFEEANKYATDVQAAEEIMDL